MIVFSLICALLLLLALACILPPLRHPDRLPAASTETQANVAVYRRQLAEMESDLRHRTTTSEQFLQDREELEQRLIVDLHTDSNASGQGSSTLSSGMFVYALALGLPLAVVLLYLALGTPSSFLKVP